MLTFDELIDEMCEVRGLFSSYILLSTQSAIDALKLGELDKAIRNLKAIRPKDSEEVYDEFVDNWIFIIKNIKKEGFLISEGEFTSFRELANKDLVRVNNDTKTLTKVVSHLTGKLYIPEDVKYIGSDCFDRSFIDEVFLPDTIRDIKASAFTNSGISKITLPKEFDVIHRRMFKGCIFLKEITLPPNVHIIGESAFEGCSALRRVVLGENIEEIGEFCFENCVNLENVEFTGEKLEFIGSGAFKRCESLKEFNIRGDKRLRIDELAFFGCNNCTINLFTECTYSKNSFEKCFEVNKYFKKD